MTCNGCAAHVDHKVNKLDGIIHLSTAYQLGNAIVEFEKSKQASQNLRKQLTQLDFQ